MSSEVISFSCSLHYVMTLVRFLVGSPIPMLSNGGGQLLIDSEICFKFVLKMDLKMSYILS